MAEIQTYPDGVPAAGDKVPYVADPTGTPALKLAGIADIASASLPTIDDPAVFAAHEGPSIGLDEEFNGTGTTLPAGWSWIGQGDATYVEQFGAGCITMPSTDYIGRYLVMDAPDVEGELSAAPWTLTAKLTGGIRDLNYTGYGIVLAETASGKAVRFENSDDGGLRVRRYQSDRSTSDGNYSTAPKLAFERPVYLRVTHLAGDPGTATFRFGWSYDGIGWFWHGNSGLGTEIDVAAWTTPNKIGFFGYSSSFWELTLACHWFRMR